MAVSPTKRSALAGPDFRVLFEAVPGEHVGLQTDNAQAFYETLGFRLQPDFMSRVSGRWLENDANRD